MGEVDKLKNDVGKAEKSLDHSAPGVSRSSSVLYATMQPNCLWSQICLAALSIDVIWR